MIDNFTYNPPTKHFFGNSTNEPWMFAPLDKPALIRILKESM